MLTKLELIIDSINGRNPNFYPTALASDTAASSPVYWMEINYKNKSNTHRSG